MARITGGRCRGRVLREPVAPNVRPTSDRVREALFSIVGQDLSGQRVLDAFGGTGVLALEAWSRGAQVVLVEKDRRAMRGIERRFAELGAERPDAERIVGDVLSLAPALGTFDGVLVDPPWADDVTPILAALAPLTRGWLVLEAEDRTTAPDEVADLTLDRRRTYGRTALWLYRRGDQASNGRLPVSSQRR